jgi:hypothetical protein
MVKSYSPPYSPLPLPPPLASDPVRQALDSLACKRRVLLSGTPLQNHLDEVRGAITNRAHPIAHSRSSP